MAFTKGPRKRGVLKKFLYRRTFPPTERHDGNVIGKVAIMKEEE